jgi:hypothetical protein
MLSLFEKIKSVRAHFRSGNFGIFHTIKVSSMENTERETKKKKRKEKKPFFIAFLLIYQ